MSGRRLGREPGVIGEGYKVGTARPRIGRMAYPSREKLSPPERAAVEKPTPRGRRWVILFGGGSLSDRKSGPLSRRTFHDTRNSSYPHPLDHIFPAITPHRTHRQLPHIASLCVVFGSASVRSCPLANAHVFSPLPHPVRVCPALSTSRPGRGTWWFEAFGTAGRPFESGRDRCEFAKSWCFGPNQCQNAATLARAVNHRSSAHGGRPTPAATDPLQVRRGAESQPPHEVTD
jgi:hypothetical protein